MKTVVECARHRLAGLPDAVSGSGGHSATFRAACEIVRFGLSDGDAMNLLREWNRSHCTPPWNEIQLAHKLKDARRLTSYKVGTFAAKPAVRVKWKIERKAPKSPHITPIGESSPTQVQTVPDQPATRPSLSKADSEAVRRDSPPPGKRSIRGVAANDCLPWLRVAEQVLAGKFKNADDSTARSLAIGLQAVDHPDCRRALERLSVPGKNRSK